jgi:hypothetical protein
MKALVVYESLWGNTATIAKAIAEGIGGDAEAKPMSLPQAESLAGVDLIVAGAPLLGFSLPSETIVDSIRKNPRDSATSPDTSQPSARAWLESVPAGAGLCAGFETRIWWSPGSSAKALVKGLETKGYRRAAEPAKFVVTGRYGPLKEGEIQRARAWGEELARIAATAG